MTAVVPTAEQETRFWDLLESAWSALGPEPNALRHRLAERPRTLGEDELYALDPFLAPFLERLESLCEGMTSTELTDLDRVLERALHEIDRADVHEVTDGSDDGFLYARGFIVAAGREFFEAVRADAEMAILDAGCEEMCYFFDRLHRKAFDDYTDTGSGISRESCSNTAHWPDLA
ncbi:DUF4240 domain-containing protein [Actinoplanes rectilineatus]|uniref:DUF4240 domain-containing protein n=1 Tax=Actinoplanes rectilineatus TaxID=113571 RepID=UPI0005F2C79E|nr:DUF4240 domain-containing protein [Actinoplanes rectilineatus]